MNRINIVGNLGNDVEQKQSKAGNTYWSISVATTERWKDKQGQQQSETTWHKCMLFGNYQNLAPYLRKGQQVAVEGKQQHKSYVDQQNVTKYISYIKVDNIELCGSKQEGQQNPSQQPQQSPVQQAPTQNNPVQNPVQQPQQNPSQDNISQFESQNDDLPF